jgi:hypothetical protein
LGPKLAGLPDTGKRNAGKRLANHDLLIINCDPKQIINPGKQKWGI